MSELVFSALPGRHERHLQRRYRNPLFPPARREVTFAQQMDARSADRQEAEAFETTFMALLEEAVALQPNAPSEQVLELRERIDRCYEQACGLGGERQAQKAALDKLHAVVLRSIHAGASNDPQARQELERLEQARAMHLRLLEFTVVADLLSPDSPIAEDELAPTLLSEADAAVRAVLDLFDEEQRQGLAAEVQRRVECLHGEGVPMTDAQLANAALMMANPQ